MTINIEKEIQNLTNKNATSAYQSLQLLQQESKESNTVYPYLTTFINMMNSEKSYVRLRGILLCIANVKWDTKDSIVSVLKVLLIHIEDEKPFISRQCIQAIPEIVRYKPQCAPVITAALLETKKLYNTNMQPLIYKDRKAAIRKIEQYLQED